MRHTTDGPHDGAGRSTSLRHAAIVVVVVLSTVLAGCSGIPFLGGGGDGGPNVEASTELTEKLSVSPGTVYERVEEMTGIDARRYPEIEVVYETIGSLENQNSSGTFLRLMVGPQPKMNSTRINVEYSYMPIQEKIYIHISKLRESSDERIQTIVAGEFFRALMSQQNWTQYNLDTRWLNGPISSLAPKDGFIPQVLIRGSVNYIQSSYADRYLDTSVTIIPEVGSEATVWDKWTAVTHSRIGMEYFQQTLDSPTGLTEFFSGDIPAKTTEQILHDTSDTSRNVPVDLDLGNLWVRAQPAVSGPIANLLPDPRNPRGEYGLSLAMQEYLSKEVADSAAEGWGSEAIVTLESFYNNNTRGVVWALTWDSPSEADEFVSAMRTLEDAREAEPDSINITVSRPADDTTVVYGGDSGFYTLVNASFTDGTLHVTAR